MDVYITKQTTQTERNHKFLKKSERKICKKYQSKLKT